MTQTSVDTEPKLGETAPTACKQEAFRQAVEDLRNCILYVYSGEQLISPNRLQESLEAQALVINSPELAAIRRQIWEVRETASLNRMLELLGSLMREMNEVHRKSILPDEELSV